MHQLGLNQVLDNAAQALRAGKIELAEQLIMPALDQKPDVAALYFYAGTICAQKGQNALGLLCLQRSYELDPNPAVWANSAACLREMQQIGLTRQVLERGLEHAPWDVHIRANLCGSYVQDGNPLPGIEYGREVMNDEDVGPAVKFNCALLNLEAGNLAEGFALYAEGHHRFRESRGYDPDPPVLTPDLHREFAGKGKRLVVFGEQGLGDEIMMATVLPDVMRDYDVVFDHHPRLEWMYAYSSLTSDWPNDRHATLHPTRKTQTKGWSTACDAKIAIGNLGQFYRTSFDKFPSPPFYGAPKDLAASYRERLVNAAAGRKIVGIATRGGLMHTGRLYRVMPQSMLEHLFADESCMYVNLDYEDMTGLCEWVQGKYGDNKLLWFPSINWHWQYEMTAALVAATDCVVTVPQTVAHLSAAMGHPTYVMTSSKPDWRMCLTGEQWHWYPSDRVRLLRQQGDDWEPALLRLSELLGQSSSEPVQLLPRQEGSPLWPQERTLMNGLPAGSMCELGAKRNVRGTYKAFFEANGWRHVSIDLNGLHGSLNLDLQEPINLLEIGGPFDVVTNFGTTEHVDDQDACWRNVHWLVNVGGYLISSTPLDWPKHGRWYPTGEWYVEFAALNGYEVQLKFQIVDSTGQKTLCVRMRKIEHREFAFPASPMIEMVQGKTGSYD